MSEYYDPRTLVADVLISMAPPPDLTVSQWADKHRRLSDDSSSMPGIFRTSRTEYMREPMDMVGSPGVTRITFMSSAQVAKTTFIENVIAYLIHGDPCPILHVSPTIKTSTDFSKERLAPMLRDTPVLRGAVKDAKSRDSDNTITNKKFKGGHLALVGANAPSGLASRPIRAVLFDEVDRFERSAGSEGDPISLAIKRTTTFWNRIIISVSTPGDKATSRIEEEYLAGDQRQFHVPCHDCGHHQALLWEQVQGFGGQGKYSPEDAYYVCSSCGSCWNDTQRNQAVAKGHWVAQRPFNGHVSYHLNQLYSPFAPLADGVRDFLAAKGDPMLLKTWVNTFLGETWEDEGERLEYSDLMDQREDYFTDIPDEVTLLTAAVDVQDDRLELEILGWCDSYASKSIKYQVIYGDLSTEDPWAELLSILKQTYMHPTFGEIAIRATCIDTGGHYTQKAYDLTTKAPRIFAVKGVGGVGKPMVGKPSRNNIAKVQLFPLGVDTIKEVVAARLRVRDPDAPGYCAFPQAYDEDYFRGLTAEKLVTRFTKGRKRQEWIAVRKRNEPWDLRVYNTAALEILDVDLNAQRRALILQAMRDSAPPKQETKPEKPYVPTRSKRKKGNFVTGWQNES